VCHSLAKFRQAFAGYSQSFDAALVAPSELARALSDAGAIEKMAAAVSSLIAARIADGAGQGGAKAQMARLAARSLAQASGTSLTQAWRSIEAAKAMNSQPDLALAAKAGELSRQQTGLMASAAIVNPQAVADLVQAAKTSSLSELAARAERARAAVDDMDARLERVHAQRSARDWTDELGTWHMLVKGRPDVGAQIMAALEPFTDAAFRRARAEGRRERREAYAFDALVDLVQAGGQHTIPGHEILVRIDHEALLRGYTLEGETCEIAGFGTVTPKVVHDIMETRDPFLKAVVTKGKDVIGVAHLGRRPTAYQSTALDWLFPTCAAEGCGARGRFLQTDHRIDWSKTHYTSLPLLDRLCGPDHRLKTEHGWALVEGKGKRPFVSPQDPRHPMYRELHPQKDPGG